MARLTVIESNLFGEHGHYAEFVRSLASCTSPSDELIVLCDEALPDSVLADAPRVTVERPFRLIGRQREERRVLRACLERPDPFLLLTSRHTDVLRLEGAVRATGIEPTHARLPLARERSDRAPGDRRMHARAAPRPCDRTDRGDGGVPEADWVAPRRVHPISDPRHGP
jgi:hypothetical protein